MLSNEFIWTRRLRMQMDLIPGPPHGDKVLYSAAIQVLARYPAEVIAAAMSMVPNINVELDGTLDPRAWRWRWAQGNRSIHVGFSTLDAITTGQAATWGGCTLDADCQVGDLITLWENLRKTHPNIWIHFNGRVFTPQKLFDNVRVMFEDHVLTDLWE